MRYFYSHLIEIESVASELDKIDLSDEERVHLAHLVDSSLHHTILDAILSELSEEDKRIFLQHIHENNHNKIWQFLINKMDDVEGKIKKAADNLKDQLHRDLKEAKEKK